MPDDIQDILRRGNEAEAHQQAALQPEQQEQERRRPAFDLLHRLEHFDNESQSLANKLGRTPNHTELVGPYSTLLIELCEEARKADQADLPPDIITTDDGERLAAELLRRAFDKDAEGIKDMLGQLSDKSPLLGLTVSALLDMIRHDVLQVPRNTDESAGVVCDREALDGEEAPEESSRWTAGVFLGKARELSRRLRSWHIEDPRNLIQFASAQESRRWERLTFGKILGNVNPDPNPRPKCFQIYPHQPGAAAEQRCVGEGDDNRTLTATLFGPGDRCEVYDNPDRDTDRSLTQWLMGDFLRHLDAAAPLQAFGYLKEAFGQILALPAWTLRGPCPGEPWPRKYGPDDQGQLRGYMVTGLVVPTEFLNNLTDAAEKLLAGAPADWGAITKPTPERDDPRTIAGRSEAGQEEGTGALVGEGGVGQPLRSTQQVDATKPRTTKKRLEESQKESDKIKWQIYTYIQERHAAGIKPSNILAELKTNKDRMGQIKTAGLKANRNMVKAAINLLKQRERDQKRKKQDSPPA